jgi:CheY-like chemotaxis protein
MTGPLPRILILDDERIQQQTLTSQLAGLGPVWVFSNPGEALTFARGHPLDVAIVDARLSSPHIDGTDFLREMARWEPSVVLIVRTGEGGPAPRLDPGIRVLAKGGATRDDVRALAEAAAAESRARRMAAVAAGGAPPAIGAAPDGAAVPADQDDQMKIADGVRGLLHDLRNQITGLVYYSNLLRTESQGLASPKLGALIDTIAGIGLQMSEQSKTFFDGSFFDVKPNGRAMVGAAMAELAAHVGRNEGWSKAGKALTWVPPGRDLAVAMPQVRLVHALQHLLEYCLARAEPATEVSVAARLIETREDPFPPRKPKQVVFGRNVLAGRDRWVHLSVVTRIPRIPFERLRREFHHPSHDFRSGSLMVFGSFLSDDRCAFAISRDGDLTAFDLYLPAVD